jgi:hypothetical protein
LRRDIRDQLALDRFFQLIRVAAERVCGANQLERAERVVEPAAVGKRACPLEREV